LAPSDFHFLIHRKVLYAEESFVLTTFAEVWERDFDRCQWTSTGR
jgi:hypothetical protein